MILKGEIEPGANGFLVVSLRHRIHLWTHANLDMAHETVLPVRAAIQVKDHFRTLKLDVGQHHSITWLC